MSAIEGGCLCGRCRYACLGQPGNVRACHCRICQKATGAPFYARVLVSLDQVEMSGPIRWYNSSEQLDRGFCAFCGTTMFSRRASANMIGLTLGSVDDPGLFHPDAHIWTSSKQHWVAIEDGVAKYEGAAPS